jgi:hypothetical protein
VVLSINKEKMRPGSLVVNQTYGELVVIERVWKRGRYETILVCGHPGYSGKSTFLKVRNELVEWSFWDTAFWYFSYPFLPIDFPAFDSPV